MDLTFANPQLLWALPLALLPILVHLRARSKERILDFSGAYFLKDPALPSAVRRRRIEDLVLLSLRCLALGLAALAAAAPRWKSTGGSEGDFTPDPESRREDWVLVLDDSPSLVQRGAQGRRALEQLLADWATHLPPPGRARVAVETASGRAWGWMSGGTFRSRLSELFAESSGESGDRSAALARAARRLGDSEAEIRAALLVTDRGVNAEEGSEPAAVQRWTAALQPFTQSGGPALMAAELPISSGEQWSIDSLQAVSGPWPPVAGSPFRISARVTCRHGAGSRRLRVQSAALAGSGALPPRFGSPAPVLERTLELREGETREVNWPALQAAPGALWVQAALDPSDERPFDDQAETVIRVLPKREVWFRDLRAGSESSGLPPAEAPRQALLAALDPMAGSDLDRIRLITDPDSSARSRVLVILHGPEGARLTDLEAERLRGEMQRGASVLFIPDLTGSPDTWPVAPPWRVLGEDPLWPRAIDRAESRTEGAWKLGAIESDPPLLAPFQSGRNGDLEAWAIRRRLRLGQERAGSSNGGGSGERVVAKFDDGLPAVVARPVGNGWAVQLSLGIEPQGGLAASPVWPILMAQYVEWAAGDGWGSQSPSAAPGGGSGFTWTFPARKRNRSLRMDGPWRPDEPRRAVQPAASEASAWTMEIPGGAESLLLPAFPRPGMYRMSEEANGAVRWAACRIDALESGDREWPQGVQEALAKSALTGSHPIRDSSDLRRVLAALRPGLPLSPWLWSAFAILLAIELSVLAWRGRTG